MVIVIIILGVIAFAIYRIFKLCSLEHKFSNFIHYCKLYGYSFGDYYKHIGLDYRKELSEYKITNLFKDWDINPIAFPDNSIVVEHLVAVNFPFYERHYSNVIENHGGIRLFHFFSIFVKVEKGYTYLPEERFIGDFKGKYFSCVKFITGYAIDDYIKRSSKEALQNLIEDAKYWNGGEKVANKYKELIQLFISANKEFHINDKAPNEVELEDWNGNNHVTITLSQIYEKNNIDKSINITILKKDNSGYFQVDKSYNENEDQCAIFYSFNNECFKEKVKQENHYGDDFMQNVTLPTTRLLTQAEMLDAMWEYSVSNIPEINLEDKESDTQLIPLRDFEKANGILEVGCVVNDNTGDRFDICLCINNRNHGLYVGFSPYLGKLSYDRVANIKDKLYIKCDTEGCYFLCTKESEERWDTDTDEESQMCHYLEYGGMLSILKELNVEGKAGDYTFTNEKDF